MTNDRNNQGVNPFHIQGYIRDEKLFYGRQAELAEIWGYLRKGYNISIVAPRQLGKSSLLWYIKNKAETQYLASLPSISDPATTPKVETFYIDMQVIPTAAGFFQRLSEDLNLENAEPRTLERALENRRVIMCLDEFDRTANNDAFPEDFFALLRGLSQGENLSLVIATKIPLIQYSREGMTSPFYNIFSMVTLGPFTKHEAGELLTGIAGNARKTFKPGELEKALDTVGDFFPWNVQMMGWCWYDTGFELEKAVEKYRKFLEDKKIPGPGLHLVEDVEEVVEEMGAETHTTSSRQSPSSPPKSDSEWIPKVAAVLTFVLVVVTFYTVMARDTGMLWIEMGLVGVTGLLYAWHFFKSGGKKP
jgi:NTP pyrophosphatase (non-canonical NTP hydrolase)